MMVAGAAFTTHIDLNIPTHVFECDHVKRLVAGAASLFPKQPGSPKLPITREILIQLLSSTACVGENPSDTLNLNAAFSLAFSGFLRMGEFTWEAGEVRSPCTFAATRPTRRCITFDVDCMEFSLPRSKADKDKQGVTILVVPHNDGACAVSHMTKLIQHIPRAKDGPLFSLKNGPFTKNRVLNALNARLAHLGIPPGTYTGHSFRRGAAQHAHEMGVPIGEVQFMGRWASDAVERYYRRSRPHQIRLQRRFQTGSSVGFST